MISNYVKKMSMKSWQKRFAIVAMFVVIAMSGSFVSSAYAQFTLYDLKKVIDIIGVLQPIAIVNYPAIMRKQSSESCLLTETLKSSAIAWRQNSGGTWPTDISDLGIDISGYKYIQEVLFGTDIDGNFCMQINCKQIVIDVNTVISGKFFRCSYINNSWLHITNVGSNYLPSNYIWTSCPTCPSFYRVSGTVWNDDDQDIVIDADETEKNGFTVNGVDLNSNPAAPKMFYAKTDIDGIYAFLLPPGSYKLWIWPSSIFQITTSQNYTVNIPPSVTKIDFGIFQIDFSL